jgi:hypothetical protein
LIFNDEQRVLYTKFRISAHELEIEKGRHIGLKVEDRICQLCFHFVSFLFRFALYRYPFLFVCRYNNKRPVFLIIVESSVDINQTSLDLLSRLLKNLFISFMLFIRKRKTYWFKS